jgi:hypothetical protein
VIAARPKPKASGHTPRVAKRRQKTNIASLLADLKKFEIHVVSGIVDLGFRG